MITVKDQPNIGEYRPTWRVSFEYHWKDDKEIFRQDIIFDAVDGTYIEPRITTQDLMDSQL